MLDFLIVGQGIAGSVLALQLQKRGKRVMVINNRKTNIASSAAAGIYNPVTGRHMIKSWLADDLFPYLISFYQEATRTLGGNFLHPMPIVRPFLTAHERAVWLENYEKRAYTPFIENIEAACDNPENIYSKHGGLVLKQAGYVDVQAFLNATRDHLRALDAYLEADFRYDQVRLGKYVTYKHLRATYLIFCEGPQAKQNPFFRTLPFRLVKGELLVGTLCRPLKRIYNRGVFLVPRTTHALVGATYDWKDHSLSPTENARELLEARLHRTFNVCYTPQEQRVGIRPATFDRRPFIGLHSRHPQVGIFNGLGTKAFP